MRDNPPSQAAIGDGLSDATISVAADAAGSGTSTPPTISLSKVGGTRRGIGQKFATNPVTGRGTMTTPVATSPGRSGLGPELSISYGSAAGNSPFGFDWNLSAPSITHQTDEGLRQYNDAGEIEVFILFGAEDLLPVPNRVGTRWSQARSREGATYRVHRYRARTEGLFVRIERWTHIIDPQDDHWQSISGDNMLSLYGKDASSRNTNSEDSRRIFSLSLCDSRADKGNAVFYEYKAGEGAGVDKIVAHVFVVSYQPTIAATPAPPAWLTWATVWTS
jgi:hypothetical protein